MAALTDTLENKLIDFLLRAQALGITGATAAAGTGPANTYVALFTTAPTDAGGGAEVSPTGTNYTRATVVSSLANWNNTQASGTAVASTGTSGTTSNTNAIPFGTPGATSWGLVSYAAIFDALTGGNMLFYSSLFGSPQTISSGQAAPSFAAGALTFQLDN